MIDVATELTNHEWGMVLSADQNGHFGVIPSEEKHVRRLIDLGLFQWATAQDGQPCKLVAELSPLARNLLSARERGTGIAQ